ncbi:MAG: hypothetical protein R2875_09275 [Desulfobacterales bacterium]
MPRPGGWWNIYPDEYLLPAIAYMGIDVDTTVADVMGYPHILARPFVDLDVRRCEGCPLDGGKPHGRLREAIWKPFHGLYTGGGIDSATSLSRTHNIHPEYKEDSFVRMWYEETVAVIMDNPAPGDNISVPRPYSQ